MPVLNLESISIFHQVDSFVKSILNQHSSLRSIDILSVVSTLNQFQRSFFEIYDNDYCYSRTIDAFVGASHACIGEILLSEYIWNAESANRFIYYLLSYEPLIWSEYNREIKQKNTNRNELYGYANQVLEKYAKSLVVFVTLSYKKQVRSLISLEDFQENMVSLRDLISNRKTCFRDLVGHAWAIEQGVEKGYHCHLWLVYNGSKRQADFHIGKEIGEKWLKITNGLGEYHNSNNPETKYSYQQQGRLGIGRIHRNNLHEMQNAVSTALYLTAPLKFDQYLVVKPSGMKTFGKGILK